MKRIIVFLLAVLMLTNTFSICEETYKANVGFQHWVETTAENYVITIVERDILNGAWVNAKQPLSLHTVKLKIVDANDNSLFEEYYVIKDGTLQFIDGYGSKGSVEIDGITTKITIDKEEVLKGATGKGLIYMEHAWGADLSSMRMQKSDNLATEINVPHGPNVSIANTFPFTIVDYSSKANITKINFEYDEKYKRLYFYTDGEFLTGKNNYCHFYVKIKDAEGYVIDSGSIQIGPYSSGDKFKGEKDNFYITQAFTWGETYTIEVSSRY